MRHLIPARCLANLGASKRTLRDWVAGPDSGMRDQFTALQFDADLADDCSPLLQVTSDDAPTLLIHGEDGKRAMEALIGWFEKHLIKE